MESRYKNRKNEERSENKLSALRRTRELPNVNFLFTEWNVVSFEKS